MKTEVEEIGTGGSWTEEEKSLSASVLGSDAFTYLTKGGGAISEGLVATSTVMDLQNKLQNLVELNGQRFSWNYAIFWQLSRTKSGDIVLGWGDGSCREPHYSEMGSAAPIVIDDVSPMTKQRTRKQVLQRLHSAFGGADEEDYAPGIDRVTDTELFFLTSMYFAFPHHVGGPGKVFASGAPLWVPNNESKVLPANYCYRGFLANAAGFRTIVLLPFEAGVLELGSVKNVPENAEALDMIRSIFLGACSNRASIEKRGENGSVQASTGLAKIFGKDLNFSQPSSSKEVDVSKVDGSSWDPQKSGGSGESALLPNLRKGLQNFTWSQARDLNSHQQKFGNGILVVTSENKHHSNCAAQGLEMSPFHLQKPHQILTPPPPQPRAPRQIDFSVGSSSKPGVLISQKSTWDGENGNVHGLCKEEREDRQLRKRGRRPTNGREEPLSHVEAERQRREKLNKRFCALRAVVPNISKVDKASILEDAIAHIADLKKRLAELEAEKEKFVGHGMVDNIEQTSRPEVDIQVVQGEILVRVVSRMENHPIKKVLQAFEEAEVKVGESKVTTNNGTVAHSFVIKSPDSEQHTRKKLLASLSNAISSM
ncbi:hypothetical protein QOZ80_5AG0400700 [Eleusine coracana subsp. coracana]|nr:hypothetical protein QOZ80_5AG0400700 [Eleusine coracana subsp. coracana]